MPDAMPLVIADRLVKSFAIRGTERARLRAVDDVSLGVVRGRTLAVVGESGCGKSTVGELVLGLQRPDTGTILFDGADIAALSRDAMRTFRRRVQVVFQDPFSSLDPRERIADALMRPMRLHGMGPRGTHRQRAASLMQRVGLSPDQLDRLPHQFSGGQRQRIAIARALSVEPDLIICDEPVSALDVSVQAQVINLLQDLQRDTGVALLFISHDLAVVRHLAHEVAVMYAGRIVEQAPAARLFADPRHPYTRALLAVAPRVDTTRIKAPPLAGEPPDPLRERHGCSFAERCPHVQAICRAQRPPLAEIAPAHASACLFARDLPPTDVAAVSRVPDAIARRIAAYRAARATASVDSAA